MGDLGVDENEDEDDDDDCDEDESGAFLIDRLKDHQSRICFGLLAGWLVGYGGQVKKSRGHEVGDSNSDTFIYINKKFLF